MVSRAYFMAALNSAAGRLRLATAAANAFMTLSSSATVVPAMSRQSTLKRA